MIYVYGFLIFWCGGFFGFICAALLASIPRDEDERRETYESYSGEP